MGQCCCSQKPPYEKPSQHQSHESLEGNDINDMNATISTSPTSLSSNTNQPMLGTKTFTNGHNVTNKETISKMKLCDENTTALCQDSLNLLRALSIYHLFIHNYPQTNSKDYICDLIYNQMTKYSIIQLRNDSHHILTYHEDNRKFMKALYKKLMDLNEENGIENLKEITRKMDEDQQNRYYFGHTNDEETQMIQKLNQIHNDITYAFAHGSDDDEGYGSMAEAGDSVDEIDEDSDSMNVINDDDENQNMMGDDMDDMENSVHLMETDEDSENNKNTMKITTNKNAKRGYSKSSTVDDDDDENIEIGVSFKANERKKRRIGRLKLMKSLEHEEDDYLNKGKMKIKEDTSWMDKGHKRKNKHVPSESIQMLGNTKLVSNNSFKGSGIMDVLDETEFDLTGFNADGIDMDEDEES